MSINIGNLKFDGPFRKAEDIRPEPGLFALVCDTGKQLELIHLDETHCLRDCLTGDEYTDNLLFYSETCTAPIAAVVHYTPDLPADKRRQLKRELL